LLKRGVYVLTKKVKDDDNEKGSNINRKGIFRFNIGLRKSTFGNIFGIIPARTAVGELVDMQYDFTSLDTILPHPLYAWMGWVSILNPSEQTFEQLKPLIQEAYELAQEKLQKQK
jgi:hypothetical protein